MHQSTMAIPLLRTQISNAVVSCPPTPDQKLWGGDGVIKPLRESHKTNSHTLCVYDFGGITCLFANGNIIELDASAAMVPPIRVLKARLVIYMLFGVPV